MMTPPGFSAVLMMGILGMVGGELMVVDDSNWWETCKGPVCSVAENQAEGLARLRVLSNYIKETMTLMGTVIESLDDEMLEVGRELQNLVGRRCHARGHTALSALITHLNQTEVTDNGILEVTSDGDDSWTSGSNIAQESTPVSSSGIDVMTGSSSTSHSTSHRPSSTTHGTYSSTSHRPSSTIHGTYHSTSQRPSSTSHSTHRHSSSTSGTWRGTTQYPSSTTHTTSQHYESDREISGTSGGKTLHSRPSSTLKKYEAAPEYDPEYDEYVAPELPDTNDRQRGRGRGRHGQGQGPGQGRGGGQGRGRGRDGSHGRGVGLGLGGILSVNLGLSQCKGVPVGSPHYVPGLDRWCASNCAAGNCPSTHCVC